MLSDIQALHEATLSEDRRKNGELAAIEPDVMRPTQQIIHQS